MGANLIEVEDLSVAFGHSADAVNVVEGVGFTLAEGEILGIVGESGSGKSVSAYALMHLLGDVARIDAKRMTVCGEELVGADAGRVERIRGRLVSMIFQNARAALNPIRSIGLQIADVMRRHQNMTRREAARAAVAALAEVRIPDPERRFHAYPFELSGGMCQRVMIALALACKPKVLIADEPTTGLDVTTQATIMDMIRELSKERKLGCIAITHDLALAADYCDRIAVMHAGHLVEMGPVDDVLGRPRHPYTSMLLSAAPNAARSLEDLVQIPGALPDIAPGLPACRFSMRCPRVAPDCASLALPPAGDRGEDAQQRRIFCRHPLEES